MGMCSLLGEQDIVESDAACTLYTRIFSNLTVWFVRIRLANSIFSADFGDFNGECLSKLESDKAAEFITGHLHFLSTHIKMVTFTL